MTRLTRSRGVTLIELLTTMGILSILVGLLLPAVQSARESARRVSCVSSLRQIGLALNGYLETNGCYPILTTTTVVRQPGNRSLYWGMFSAHARLLPWLEQGALYDAINFTVGSSPLESIGYPAAGDAVRLAAAVNETVVTARVGLFLCPSDPRPSEPGAVNYRGNVGVGGYPVRTYMHPDGGNGLLSELGIVKAAHVVDGLSNTAAFSERARGSGGPADPRRDYWRIRTGIYGTADDGLTSCLIVARTTEAYLNGGDHWIWEGLDRTSYVHAQAPNGRIPDCLQGGLKPPPGISTARSFHPGGVGLLLGDGSVRFVKSSISQDVWRAVGTRDGGEVLRLDP